MKSTLELKPLNTLKISGIMLVKFWIIAFGHSLIFNTYDLSLVIFKYGQTFLKLMSVW